MSGLWAIRTGRGVMATTHRWFHLLIDGYCVIKVAGEVSLTTTRHAEYRCVAVDCQHVKQVAVVVLKHAAQRWATASGTRHRHLHRCHHRPGCSHQRTPPASVRLRCSCTLWECVMGGCEWCEWRVRRCGVAWWRLASGGECVVA